MYIKVLLEAKVDAQDKTNALASVAEKTLDDQSRESLVKVLLEAGGDWSLADKKGRTALSACNEGEGGGRGRRFLTSRFAR